MNKIKIPYHKPFPLDDVDLIQLQNEVRNILKSGMITNGLYVEELEGIIRKMYDVDYCIATANCTIGLYLCYKYFAPDTIYMPNFTWVSPYWITQQPKHLYDVKIDTWLMDIDKMPAVNGIISPNHTFGNVLNMEGDYKIIFDGAHALGSKIENIGEATVFSLAPTKLVTSCEGGLIVTNNEYLAGALRVERDKCARMSEVHATIGLQTLYYIDIVKKWKAQVYDYYKKHIPGKFQKVEYDSNYNTIGFVNTHLLDIPDHIETRQYYEPLLKLPHLTVSDYIYKRMVCLPSYYDCPYKQIVEDIKELNDL